MAELDRDHASYEMGMHTEQLAGRTQQVFFLPDRIEGDDACETAPEERVLTMPLLATMGDRTTSSASQCGFSCLPENRRGDWHTLCDLSGAVG